MHRYYYAATGDIYGESLSSSYIVLSEANLADLKTVTMIEVSTRHVSVYAFRCYYHDTSNGNLVYTSKLRCLRILMVFFDFETRGFY